MSDINTDTHPYFLTTCVACLLTLATRLGELNITAVYVPCSAWPAAVDGDSHTRSPRYTYVTQETLFGWTRSNLKVRVSVSDSSLQGLFMYVHNCTQLRQDSMKCTSCKPGGVFERALLKHVSQGHKQSMILIIIMYNLWWKEYSYFLLE